MKLSPITKQQWMSVIKNVIIAGLASFTATIQVVGLTKAGAITGLTAAFTAAVKVVEKSFTQG